MQMYHCELLNGERRLAARFEDKCLAYMYREKVQTQFVEYHIRTIGLYIFKISYKPEKADQLQLRRFRGRSMELTSRQ
jgi:hypothetical protein